jgi:predicted metal-dependent enzyme (double-stranded beta helix superfamily)
MVLGMPIIRRIKNRGVHAMSTQFKLFIAQLKELTKNKSPLPEMLDSAQVILRELLRDQDWFRETLSQLVLSEDYLQSQFHSIDPNDIQLYHSPDKAFSVSAYIWEPEVPYPIHDHGAWGIVGSLINPFKEVKYEVTESGNESSYTELRKTRETIIQPGQTAVVLPLNLGIHQMLSINQKISVSIHIYGPRVRRGYIQIYHPENKTIQRVYRPLINKKILAIRTLGAIPDGWAKDVLLNVMEADGPDFIEQEVFYALKKRESK